MMQMQQQTRDDRETQAETDASGMSGLDIERVDRFVELLLAALYELGLAPMRLSERPAAFEKHPRELFAYLRLREREPAQSQVEGAFQEWQAWLLRKVEPELGFVKEKAFPRLAELHAFMRKNADLFDRRTLTHLRKSIYGRIYAYLYPRLRQILVYRDYCKEAGLLSEKVTQTRVRRNQDGVLVEKQIERPRVVYDEAFIRQHFAEGTSAAWHELVDIYGEARAAKMREAAISFLLDNPHYFNIVFSN